MNHMAGWWCNVPILKNVGVKVNGKDDIPYMKWKIKHAPNHQPAVFNPTGTESLSLVLKMWNIGEWMEHLGTTTLFRDGTVMQCGLELGPELPQPRNPLTSANLGSAWSCNSSRQSCFQKADHMPNLWLVNKSVYPTLSSNIISKPQHLPTSSNIFQPHPTKKTAQPAAVPSPPRPRRRHAAPRGRLQVILPHSAPQWQRNSNGQLLVDRCISLYHGYHVATWWLIPLSKWVITPVINGISRVNPLITGVITHLLSGMSHQVGRSKNYLVAKNHLTSPDYIGHTMIYARFLVAYCGLPQKAGSK